MNVATQTNALLLCTGDSTRSVLGEVLLNALGSDRFSELVLIDCPMVHRI